MHLHRLSSDNDHQEFLNLEQVVKVEVKTGDKALVLHMADKSAETITDPVVVGKLRSALNLDGLFGQ